MTTNSSDNIMRELIQNAIDAGWVSVFFDPSGQIKEYTVRIFDDMTLVAGKYMSHNDGMRQYYDYEVTINGVEIFDVTIAENQKKYTPSEQEVLNLYKRLSNKVIFQEMATAKSHTYNA